MNLTLSSDSKIGSTLSGGIDSSILVACVNNEIRNIQLNFEQECFSACFYEKKIDESKYIFTVTNKLKLNTNKVYPTFTHFEKEFDKLVWHQEEPFPTMSIYAHYCVFEEAAKRNVRIILNGQGADEMLAGYHYYYPTYFNELKTNRFYAKLNSEWKSYKHNIQSEMPLFSE